MKKIASAVSDIELNVLGCGGEASGSLQTGAADARPQRHTLSESVDRDEPPSTMQPKPDPSAPAHSPVPKRMRRRSSIRGGRHSFSSLESSELPSVLMKPRIQNFVHDATVTSACFSPDGTLIATGCDDAHARVFDVDTGKEILKTIALGGKVTVCFSADGKSVGAGSEDKNIYIFDVPSDCRNMFQSYGCSPSPLVSISPVLTIKDEHEGKVNTVCFSPDGTLIASGSDDCCVRIFDTKSGSRMIETSICDHRRAVTSVCFSCDGTQIATGCADMHARVFSVSSITRTDEKLSNNKLVFKLRLRKKHEDKVTSVGFSFDGRRIVTGSDGGFARIFDIDTKQEMLKTLAFKGKVTVCFSPDDTSIATGSEDKCIRVFDIATGSAHETLKSVEFGIINSVMFSQDGSKIAIGSNDNHARIVHVCTGQETLKQLDFLHLVTIICFSPDSKRIIACTEDKFLHVYDIASGHPVIPGVEFEGLITSACFSEDGRRIATGSHEKVAIASVFEFNDCEQTLDCIRCFEHELAVSCVCFSPNGDQLATSCHDCFVRVFKITTGDKHGPAVPFFKSVRHGGLVSSVSFSSDGLSLATGSADTYARIFDLSAGENVEEILRTIEHGGGVKSVCFAPDSRQIATASYDRFARIFIVKTGEKMLATIKGHDVAAFAQTTRARNKLRSVIFSKDGKTIATSSEKFSQIFIVDNSHDLRPCMMFHGTAIALSSQNHISWIKGKSVTVISRPHNFATEAWLPAPIDLAIAWSGIPKELRTTCDFTDAQLVRSEFFASKLGDRQESVADNAHSAQQDDEWSDSSDSDDDDEFRSELVIHRHPKTQEQCQRIKEILSKTTLFQHVSGKILNDLVGGFYSVRCSDGDQIIVQGDVVADKVFLLDSGMCDVFVHNSKVHTYQSGGVFGERALLNNAPRAATVVSNGESWLWALDRGAFKSCMARTNAAKKVIETVDDKDVNDAKWPFKCKTGAKKESDVRRLRDRRGGGIVALAEKWQNAPEMFWIKSFLIQIFQGDEPLVNVGAILNAFLNTRSEGLPNAEIIGALLSHASRHIKFVTRDNIFTEELARAACIPNLRSTVNEFWAQLELIHSHPMVMHGVSEVTFSEEERMYVAGSEYICEPVFANYFKRNGQFDGVSLEFEHFLVPLAGVSVHRDGDATTHGSVASADKQGGFAKAAESTHYASLLQALVDTDDISIFGTPIVRAIVMFKWVQFARWRWIKEIAIYLLGLCLLVALSIMTWERDVDPNEALPPVEVAVVSSLFGAIVLRSLYREARQFINSIPTDNRPLFIRMFETTQFDEIWNWLDLMQIMLGIASVILVWWQSPIAVPALSVTAYLRWWGILFYLQVKIYLMGRLR